MCLCVQLAFAKQQQYCAIRRGVLCRADKLDGIDSQLGPPGVEAAQVPVEALLRMHPLALLVDVSQVLWPGGFL
jgi:hypothetical protein